MRHTISIPAVLTCIGWIIIIATMTGVMGCGGSTQPTAAGPAPGENKSPPAKPTSPKPAPDFSLTPDYSLTAKAFFDEVINDINAAGKKYGGRVVEVTGKLAYLSRHQLDPNESPSLFLDAGPQQAVVCSTVDKQPWLKCVHGQTVKVRGKVNGGLLFAAVGMNDCEFIVVSGNPAAPLSVTQLLKDIAADQEAAKKKYDGKVVLLSGEFVSVKEEVGNGYNRRVELKGDGKRPIYCNEWSSDGPLLMKLKPGEQVTFLGVLKVTNAGSLKLTNDNVELENAILTRASVLAL